MTEHDPLSSMIFDLETPLIKIRGASSALLAMAHGKSLAGCEEGVAFVIAELEAAVDQIAEAYYALHKAAGGTG